MRRRHRRVLFNLFAFSLLGVAIYLNMFRMREKPSLASNLHNRITDKQSEKINSLSKINLKEK